MANEQQANNLPVSFYFSISLTGAHITADASFQEVSGISVELDMEEISEGGENKFNYKMPAHAKYSNLVLKHGIVAANSDFAAWCIKSVGSDFSKPVMPKTLTLFLLNESGDKLMSWDFINAYPVEWSISDLKSQDNSLVIESVEFAYNYFTRIS